MLGDLPGWWQLTNCDGKLAITGSNGAECQVRLVDWISGATVEQHSLPAFAPSMPTRSGMWLVMQ